MPCNKSFVVSEKISTVSGN